MHQKLSVPAEPDPQEVAEWIEAFDQIVDEGGARLTRGSPSGTPSRQIQIALKLLF